MDGQSWLSNVTVHKIIKISSIFEQKKIITVWDRSQPAVFCIPSMSWPLSHVSEFCNAGKEKNLEVEFLDAA
jgi:hypothetical protein